MAVKWAQQTDFITEQLNQGISIEDLAEHFQVTRQRLYQVLDKFNLDTPIRKCKRQTTTPEKYWLNRVLVERKVPVETRHALLQTLETPSHCPVFGVELNYLGTGNHGFCKDTDKSPSLDRIDSSKGYEAGNLQVISWRANRIKNDSTPEELRKLADHMENISV